MREDQILTRSINRTKQTEISRYPYEENTVSSCYLGATNNKQMLDMLMIQEIERTISRNIKDNNTKVPYKHFHILKTLVMMIRCCKTEL